MITNVDAGDGEESAHSGGYQYDSDEYHRQKINGPVNFSIYMRRELCQHNETHQEVKRFRRPRKSTEKFPGEAYFRHVVGSRCNDRRCLLGSR